MGLFTKSYLILCWYQQQFQYYNEMATPTSLFTNPDSFTPNFSYRSFKHVIIDRKSKYTVTWWAITSKQEGKNFMKQLLKDKTFRKATHNTYARRIQREDWWVMEWKHDDGETWAWNCILRELQRAQAINIILVVTRYYGWIHLHADRFKNVMNASKIFFERINL